MFSLTKLAAFRKMSPEQHEKLLGENVTKTYQKVPTNLQKSMNLKAKHISTNIKLNNRNEKPGETPVYVTLKNVCYTQRFRSKLDLSLNRTFEHDRTRQLP